jgi:hypothetical protein
MAVVIRSTELFLSNVLRILLYLFTEKNLNCKAIKNIDIKYTKLT